MLLEEQKVNEAQQGKSLDIPALEEGEDQLHPC